MAKSFKDSFNSLASRIPKSSGKTCAQCTNQDCGKCKHNMNSYNHIFGSDQKLILPDCYYYAEYYSAPDINFDNWTLNGAPFNSQIGLITGNASNSINPYAYPIIYDDRFAWIVTNDPTSLPLIPEGKDSFGNPTNPIWMMGSCIQTCWELIVPGRDIFFGSIYLGISINTFIDYQAFGMGLIDVSNPLFIAAIDTYYKSAFGLQSSVTSSIDINGDIIIQIRNTWESFPPLWNNQTLGSLYFYQIDCP